MLILKNLTINWEMDIVLFIGLMYNNYNFIGKKGSAV